MSDTDPRCPACGAALELGTGERAFWTCPAGHGVGFTVTAAYGHVDGEAIKDVWRASESAPMGGDACPFCANSMVTVELPVEGGATLTFGVCREDEVFWLTPADADRLPAARPDAGPSAEELRNLEAVRRAFDAGEEHALHEEHDHGFLDKVADGYAKHHPEVVAKLDHAMFGDELDDLRDETPDPAQAGEPGAPGPGESEAA